MRNWRRPHHKWADQRLSTTREKVAMAKLTPSGTGTAASCEWGELVKVFKLPSPMQEAILMAFEEEHWPPRIDDPLPMHPVLLPKRRLHDTIKSLNRNQKSCLIRFMGDGTGEGIRWEMVSSHVEAEESVPILR